MPDPPQRAAAGRSKAMPRNNQSGGPWGSGPQRSSDFEEFLRRSQDRLGGLLVLFMQFYRMNRSSFASHLRVEVKHRCAAPKRYTWEIFSEGKMLPVEESTDQFRSWEEASQAGKKALEKIISKSRRTRMGRTMISNP